jgi:hypothetical protein
MKPNSNNRLRKHINSGNRAFLPLSRMRRIRFEESVQYSIARRNGRKDKLTCVHFDCSCGSINCLANPIVQKAGVNET